MADQTLSLLVEYSAAELVASARDVRYTQLLSFVAATIVVYDYIVCFEREVELIWKKRWSVIKLAFLWHRYFGVLCVLFQAYALNSRVVNDECLVRMHRFARSCAFWFYWETWGYSAVLFTSEAVLLLWIYVIYNKNRWVLAILASCYVAEVAGVVTILTISFESFEVKANGIPGIEYCVMTNIGSPFSQLGCAGASCSRRWAYTYTYDGLLDMIYRHSLLNFLAIFGSYLACAVIWLTSEFGLYQIPLCFALSLSITNCTRLLLNIRRAYYCSGPSDPLLCNIGGLPSPSGSNTPTAALPAILLDVALSPSTPHGTPTTPVSISTSALSHLSGATLREPSVTPTSTLRVACAGSASTLLATSGHGGRSSDEDGGGVWLRTVAAGPHRALMQECHGVPPGDRRERPVYLSAEVGAQWWQQYELREMRQSEESTESLVHVVSVGEAV